MGVCPVTCTDIAVIRKEQTKKALSSPSLRSIVRDTSIKVNNEGL